MRRLPWTKFQDFYLRPGFLKVLVAVLSPDRRSALNDAIIRRLERPLFDPAPMHAGLWAAVADRISPRPSKSGESDKKKGDPSVVEALLLSGDCPSLLFAITGPTAYKILDWGKDVELIGRGNQITERGLLLRHLLDDAQITQFLSGTVEVWNPFVLSLKERLFLLYHLIEIDGLIFELIKDLGRLPEGTSLESSDAARMTSTALLRVLSSPRGGIQPRDVLQFRVACNLAATIADELGMGEEAAAIVGKKPIRPTARRSLGGVGRGVSRKTTKNADHQTIPRFEQLVDLGFLVKPGDDAPTDAERQSARKRWRYIPTEACRRWSKSLEDSIPGAIPFLWNGFARSCFQTFEIQSRTSAKPAPGTIVEYVWRSYEHIHRRAGPNPLDSVALYAMISAAADGICLEMCEVHRVMLDIKQGNLLPEHAFFSSGNDLDQMFIQLKPGFVEQFTRRDS